jgi:hypothetical protein
LLKDPSVNPHATMLTLFINAVIEESVFKNPDHLKGSNYTEEMMQVYKYTGVRAEPSNYDTTGMFMLQAIRCVRDVDKWFQK